MTVKIRGMKELKKAEELLFKRLASEATRVVTTTRSKITADVVNFAKKGGLVSPRMTKQKVKKYIFSNPKKDTITVRMLHEGFSKVTKISAFGMPIYHLRVKSEIRLDKGETPRKRPHISLIIGSQTYEYPGVFLIAEKKWIPKPISGPFFGMYRTSKDRNPIAGARAISLAKLLRENGFDELLPELAFNDWHESMKDRLGRVIERFTGK